jgi:class 3 adenylate cyclase
MEIIKQDEMVKANIAIVLTDIIGSTKFVERNGNLNAAKWFKVHDKHCISLIYRFNGILCDASDGFLMYFNTVQDALAFSFAYKKSLLKHKFPFATRIGIHYDSMLILKTPQSLIDINHKRISLEGIGKNVAARTMSICGSQQILLTTNAYNQYARRLYSHSHIPKGALIASAGLYEFKGVKNPEQIWVAALNALDLTPPLSGEKVKRLAGPKKINIKLRNRKLKQKIEFYFWKISFLYIFFLICSFWNLISSPTQKKMWNLDYWFLKPFDYLNFFFSIMYDYLRYLYVS